MKTRPWLTIIGLDAGGYDSLKADAQSALSHATTIIGPQRHIDMLPDLAAKQIIWPVPFQDGIDILLDLRRDNDGDNQVVMLASGDPFWFGAGTQITRHLEAGEWQALPGAGCFSLAASQLGWAIETTSCLGLHAAPFSRLRPYLQPRRQILATLRDGNAIAGLAGYLSDEDFADSQLTILEALGSVQARITTCRADALPDITFQHPVMVGIKVAGYGQIMPQSAGLNDDWFQHDGQITKQMVRAFTLSALAPSAGQHLWDLGAGSGSVSIEWLLSGPQMRATAVEQHPERAARIRANADRLGVDWLTICESDNLSALSTLDRPDAIFIGGGLREPLLTALWDIVPEGTRLVANGVTVETDRLLTGAQEQYGGTLTRLELSKLDKIGSMRGWKAAYPITQWVVVR